MNSNWSPSPMDLALEEDHEIKVWTPKKMKLLPINEICCEGNVMKQLAVRNNILKTT